MTSNPKTNSSKLLLKDTSLFTAIVEKNFVNELIEAALNKTNNHLYNILIQNYKITRYDKKYFNDCLKRWKNSKRQIPLDIYLALCHFTNSIPKLEGIRLINCKNYLKVNYPIPLDDSILFISECIRVEGHLKKKTIIFENTNTELINKLKIALFSLGINKSNLNEVLHIKIQIPLDVKKEEITLVNLTQNKIINKFHERTLNLVSGKKKEIIFIENKFNYEQNLDYILIFDKTTLKIKIKIPTAGKIIGISNFVGINSHNVSPSLRLDIHNKTLAYLLNKYFEIPYGNKSKIITIPQLVKECPNSILNLAIGGIFASEANINSKSRAIKLCSMSPEYIKDFQSLLLKWNIDSKINKNILGIYGIANFRKIKENFDLIINSKNNSLNQLLIIQEEQSKKGFAELFYFLIIYNLKTATIQQIKEKTGRKGNSFKKYIQILLNKGYIEYLNQKNPRVYRVMLEQKLSPNFYREKQPKTI